MQPSDRCLLVWLYRPPPTTLSLSATSESRLETHVVRLSTERRARRLAVRIGDAFQRLYVEMEAAQAVSRLQAADERRSKASPDDEPESSTTRRTTSTTIASDMAVIQYLQYANAAFDDEDADEVDVQTFQTFRPVVQTTEV